MSRNQGVRTMTNAKEHSNRIICINKGCMKFYDCERTLHAYNGSHHIGIKYDMKDCFIPIDQDEEDLELEYDPPRPVPEFEPQEDARVIEDFNRQMINYERFYTNRPVRPQRQTQHYTINIPTGNWVVAPNFGNDWATTAVNEGETID